MKIRRPIPHITRALASLSRSIDPATGAPYRYRSIDGLKALCRLEEVVTQCLEQEPENPDANELKFVCIWHDDVNPSLWVNVEKQRWGCNAGCYSSGDVIDFVKKVHDMDQRSALEWLRVWATYHQPRKPSIRIRLRKGGGAVIVRRRRSA